MNIFQIDWGKFTRENVPIALRRPIFIRLLASIIGQIRNLHYTFLDHRTDWLYKIRHTSQVIHIEKVLNDKFDRVQRRIYIQNVTFASYLYLWPDGEKPHYLQEDGADPDRPLYLLEEDAGVISPDATIYVPAALRPSLQSDFETFENSLRGLVEYYKTYAVNYQIIYYE